MNQYRGIGGAHRFKFFEGAALPSNCHVKFNLGQGSLGSAEAGKCECNIMDIHMVSLVDLNVPFAKAKENLDELCKMVQFINDISPATHCAVIEIPQMAKKSSKRGICDEEADLQQKLWGLRQVCDDRWFLPFDLQPSAENNSKGKRLVCFKWVARYFHCEETICLCYL